MIIRGSEHKRFGSELVFVDVDPDQAKNPNTDPDSVKSKCGFKTDQMQAPTKQTFTTDQISHSECASGYTFKAGSGAMRKKSMKFRTVQKKERRKTFKKHLEIIKIRVIRVRPLNVLSYAHSTENHSKKNNNY
jgi:hypothetical protein